MLKNSSLFISTISALTIILGYAKTNASSSSYANNNIQSNTNEISKLDITFSQNGKLIKKLSHRDLNKISQAQTISFLEPHEQKNKKMQGFKFVDILQSVYGKDLAKFKTITFTCLDGYQPKLDLSAVLSGEAYLAFAEVGSKEFIVKKGDKKIQVGPYYLVWKHKLTGEKLNIHLHQGHWPYQVNGIDLIAN